MTTREMNKRLARIDQLLRELQNKVLTLNPKPIDDSSHQEYERLVSEVHGLEREFRKLKKTIQRLE